MTSGETPLRPDNRRKKIMMNVNSNEWYVRSHDGKVYGPTTLRSLVVWAEEGRVEPGGFVSTDRKSWTPAQLLPELEMKWVVEAEPGKFYGPFNRKLVSSLSKSGGIPQGASIYRRHELDIDEDPPPKIVEVEKIVEKIVEVPVEKIVEKRVEVPVEKIVVKEVRVEVPVEVPVEKIVEKIVEVPPQARTEIVEPEVVSLSAQEPPVPALAGMFKNADLNSLAALEAAARRELEAAKKNRMGGMAGFFSRRKK